MLDTSVALAWAFEDEAEGYADAALEALAGGGAVVPDLWGYEIVNALVVGERRKRISSAESTRFLALLRSLPIEIEALSFSELSGLVSLAREYGLSSYDAAYLDVAARRGLPLATQDPSLGEAARRSGVEVFGS